MTKPVFTFVLHTHLPYVLDHGTWPHGTDWLYQAAAECYLPLLEVFDKLGEDGIKPGVTIGLTPVLSEQLANPRFKEGLEEYLRERIKAALYDIEDFTTTGQLEMLKLAQMWHKHYIHLEDLFTEHYFRDIPGAFKRLQEAGALEIIACAATHGYLPLLGLEESVTAQLRLGRTTHYKHYGRQPKGIWLPECAYRPGYKWSPPVECEIQAYERPGLEIALSKEDIKYFFVDTDLLKGGEGVGVYLDRFPALKALWERMEEARKKLPEKEHPRNHHRPYWVGADYGSGQPVAVFVRDPETALLVWSGEHGYPGDGDYLEFHKKRFPNGHQYWRVTSAKADLADKQTYRPDIVESRLEENASHFVEVVTNALKKSAESLSIPPILVAPFDTELFGHWWFEGPPWIEKVLRKIAEQGEVRLSTAGEYLEEYPPDEAIAMPEGSWGQGGFHWIWLNEWTRWTWKHLYAEELRMVELVRETEGRSDEELERLLKQLGRELLLAQSSDWQFLISTWSARDYAENRFAEHQNRFERIAQMVENKLKGQEIIPNDWSYLEAVEKSDPVFPDIDYRMWMPSDE